jgi:uncharacterized protein (TIGR00369 family)
MTRAEPEPGAAPQPLTIDIGRVVAAIPHLKLLGARFHGSDAISVSLELPYRPELIGFPQTGVLAGGPIFTLMDTALGMAVITRLANFRPMATLDLRLDYLKPATPGMTVIARAECYKLTRRIAFARGVAYHEDPERPIAHATGTFMLTS